MNHPLFPRLLRQTLERAASFALVVAFGMSAAILTGTAFAQACNCGKSKVTVRGIPSGAVEDIRLVSANAAGNPVEVELVQDKELGLTITADVSNGPLPPECGQAWIEFPACAIEYRIHTPGDAEDEWGPWTKGTRFPVGVKVIGEAKFPDPDKFELRLTSPASDTADDPTGPSAGAGTDAGSISAAPPAMTWQAGDPPTATLAPPGITLTIPMGPVGLGEENTAPFRSAGTLSLSGVLDPDLAAPANLTRNSISEMSVPDPDLVREAGVSDETGQVEKHFLTPAKVFRLRGWDAATEEPEPIHGSAGSIVEEYAASQYDDVSKEFSGTPRASWRIEPVASSPDGEGIRMARTINGITTVESALVDDNGHTLVTEANGTRTAVTVAPGQTADTYTEGVSRQTDGVIMANELRTYSHFQWGYEMTERVIDPEGENLVHVQGYHESLVDEDGKADDPASHRRIKYRSEADGNWALYSYIGGQVVVLSPFCSETVPDQDFDAAGPSGLSQDSRYIRTTEEVPLEESVESLVTTRELMEVGNNTPLAVLADSSDTVESIDEDEDTVEDFRLTTTTTFRATEDLFVETRIVRSPSLAGEDAWLAGRPILEVEPTGRATHHDWSLDEQSNAVIHTETTGLADKSQGGVAVADGWYFHEVESASTRTITTTGPDGILERVAQYHTGSGFTTAHTETYSYDNSGRLEEVSMNGTPVRTFAYPSPLITVTTEAGGGTTRVETDSRGRTLSRSLMAPDTPPLTTTWTYDGLTTTMRVNGRVEETTATDTLGRPVSRTDRHGAGTSTEYTDDNGMAVVIETGPGGVERVTTTHFDGRPASLTGDLTARFHSYDIVTEENEARLATTVAEADDESPRRVTTVVNRDGSVHQLIKPTFENTGTVAETRSYHAGSDRLARIDSTAPHTPPRLSPVGTSALEKFGAIVVSGLHVGSGGLTFNSNTDRITCTTQTYVVENGSVVRVTVEETFPEPGSDAARTVTRRETLTPAACSVQGLGDGLARVEKLLTPGAGTAVRTLIRTTMTFAGAAVVEEDDSATTVCPDSATTYVAGRPVSRTVPGATTTETWVYDSFGQETRHTDLRGGTTITTYNALGQAATVTDPGGQRTTYTYYPADSEEHAHAVGLVETATDIANHTTTYLYDNQRRLISSGCADEDTATYPVAYSYDDYGALEAMTTWRTKGNQTTAAVTTWVHDPATGLLAAKFYQGQTEDPAWAYEYYADGRLSKRTSLRGIVTDYDYTDFGDLESVTYSNDSNLTPDVTYAAHDRLGRPRTVITGGDEADLSYDEISGAESIAYDTNHSALPGVSVMARAADAAGRPTGFNVLLAGNNNPVHLNTLDYDPAQGRLDEVDSGAGTTSLSWYPGSDIFKQAVTTASGNVVRRETRVVDVAGRITGVHTSTGSGGSLNTVAASGYTLDALGRRTTARREDGSTWTYGYNPRSEVTSGEKKLAGMTTEVAAGLSFAYLYDDIGNRQWAKSGGDETGANQRQTSYTPNALNQYTSIDNPRSLDVLVRAPEETISVTSTGNTVTYDDQEDYDFHRAQITTSSNNPQWVQANATAGSMITQGHLWLPGAEESPWYDADGNLLSEHSVLDGGNRTAAGRWECAWDGENRLVSMRPTQAALTAGAPNIGLDFRYDHRSRRIAKKVLNLALQPPNNIISDLRFAWDDWNMVAEFTPSGESLALVRTYTWGPDISNTLQGAGGVGGLLAVRCHSSSTQDFYPAFDGNCNVIAWSDSIGAVRRRIDYDPFGAVVTVEDSATPMPVIPLGFSTKYTDPESGLIYYGFRYLDTLTGRWRSMDPIEEEGGPNLYGFVGNDPMYWIDYLGLVGKDRCTFEISAGHENQIKFDMKQFEENKKTHCDRIWGVSCERQSSGQWKFRWATPQARSLGWKQRQNQGATQNDPIIADDIIEKIMEAEKAAEDECKRDGTCCRSIRVFTTCKPSQEMNEALQGDPRAKYACSYKNLLMCRTGKWQYQTAYSRGDLKRR